MRILFFLPITIFSLCIIISCKIDNKKKNDLQKANLNGNIYRVLTQNYIAIEKFGKIERSEKPVDEILTTPDIDFLNKSDIYYNKHGNINTSFSSFPLQPIYAVKNEYTYDKNKNATEINTYDPYGKLSSKDIIKYNDNQNIIEINKYIQTGELFTKNIYLYNNNGYIKEIEEFFGGALNSKLTYKHDVKGNIIEVNKYVYTPDEKLIESRKYEYDKKGNITKKINTQIFIHESDRAETNVKKYKYDEKNNIIEYLETVNTAFAFARFTYEFDSKGNWIKRIGYNKDNVPQIVTEREITYY